MSKCNILIHITGSISAYKGCFLISTLVQSGYQVRTTLSEGGRQFIGRATLEGLTGFPVPETLFDGEPDPVPHITLAQRWADLILVYPASANCINRLAGGLADDLFGAIFLANNLKNPVWIAPAMNSDMFAHPAVRESLIKLEQWGCRILPTENGRMACGTTGPGKLLDPEVVFQELEKWRTGS